MSLSTAAPRNCGTLRHRATASIKGSLRASRRAVAIAPVDPYERLILDDSLRSLRVFYPRPLGHTQSAYFNLFGATFTSSPAARVPVYVRAILFRPAILFLYYEPRRFSPSRYCRPRRNIAPGFSCTLFFARSRGRRSIGTFS